MQRLATRKVFVGLAAIGGVVFALIGVATNIFSDDINIWLRILWQQYPLPSAIVMGVIIVIAFVITMMTTAPAEATPPPPVVQREQEVKAIMFGDTERDTERKRTFVPEARQAEIEQLCQLLIGTPSRRWRWWPFRRSNKPQYGRVAIVTGIGGIGKTALVRHVAFLSPIRQAYPVRRYLNLNGLTAPGTADDEQALRELMRGLGMYPDLNLQLYDREKLRELYHQDLAQHPRQLLLIDDPSDTTPLEALLPPPTSGLVVITRPGMVTQRLHGAQWLSLQPLNRDAALAVLRRYWTEGFDPQVAEQICRLCSFVPLALVVAGKTIAHNQQQQPQRHPKEVAVQFAERLAQEARKRPGQVSQYFKQFVRYSAEKERQDIQTVLSLSYQLLDDPARQLFRALATFGGLPFDGPAAIRVAFGQAIQHQPLGPDQDTPEDHLRSLLNRGLIQFVAEDVAHYQERYSMYDLLYAYARYELERHPDEVQPCLERYLDYYLDIAGSQGAAFQAAQPADQPELLLTLVPLADHLRTCFATLNEPAQSNLLPDREVRLLKLVAPLLPLLQAGQALPVPTDAERPALFQPTTHAEWEQAGQQALAAIYRQQEERFQQVLVRLGAMKDWFDREAAQAIAEASPDDLDHMLALGLLQQRAGDGRYHPSGELVSTWLQAQFAALPMQEQAQVHAAYATHYAERARRYRAEPGDAQRLAAFTLDEQHICHGQHLAASATPALDQPLITYANRCFWYFDQRRDYTTLETWLQAGFAAAQRQNDPAMCARLGVDLGIVHAGRGDLDQAERYYRQVYDGDLARGADADTRASACHGLGVVHERRGDRDQAEGYYRQVYDGDLARGADADTRALACHGLGVVHAGREAWEQALGYYTRALQLDPRMAAAYRNRGLVYECLNQLQAALQDAQQALALDPGFAAARQDSERYAQKMAGGG